VNLIIPFVDFSATQNRSVSYCPQQKNNGEDLSYALTGNDFFLYQF